MIRRAGRVAAAAADVVVALDSLRRAHGRVRHAATGALVRPPGERDVATAAPSDVLARVTRANVALRRAERLLPRRPSCLVRALALARLLENTGVPGPLIRVGVRREGTALDAHAWVELDGRVVGDDARATRRFTPLGSVAPTDRG